MPGHKRNAKFGIDGAEIDITEIAGFDNLHNADGVIKNIETALSAHYKSKRSFLLVNGSTVGLLAAIFTLCDEGDKIIIARNCHKSVYNACFLRRLRIVFAEPEFDSECGYYTKITQKSIDDALLNNPDAKAVVITSPTYEGNISEIKSYVPLIVDAAHGAHLGIAPFCDYPKGDIVVSSLHKTLPALTQTAVANVYNDRFSAKLKLYLDMLETSSPSYVLMNSADICMRYIAANKGDFEIYYNRLEALRKTGLQWLRIKDSDDIGKIVVSTASASINGSEFAEALRDRYSLEVEAAGAEHVIIMTSVADTPKAFERLQNALTEIDRECDKKSNKKPFSKPPCPENEIVISVDESSIPLDISAAVGRRANEFVYAYPPDIPIIVPNEIISDETAQYIKKLINSAVNVISDSGLLPKVLTKTN